MDITIGDRELSIHQSPTILNSHRADGTTGAVVWKVTPLFATWVSSPQNALFRSDILSSDSTVVELGTGVSGIVALSLGPQIKKYIATDQDYVLKLLKQNITENNHAGTTQPRSNKGKSTKSKSKGLLQSNAKSNFEVLPLDWETDVPSLPVTNGVDAVIACDCIYNEALIEPLVTTCADICRLRREGGDTVCIVAQQLRSPDVFEAWLTAFYKLFRVWRVPDELLTEALREGSGFVVHVGVLREGRLAE